MTSPSLLLPSAAAGGDEGGPGGGTTGLPLHSYARARALGEGSFGAVVVVYSTETGEEFAGKAFDWDDDGTTSVETLRELSALRALRGARHPNIVELVDVATEFEGHLCPLQIMPLHGGGDLEHAIGTGSLTQGRRLRLARDLLRAVAFLHGCGLMHRDIKPGNVVIADDGRGVLVDFSFVRLASSSSSQASLTSGATTKAPRRRAAAARQQEQQGRVVAAPPTGSLGTPSYIAPEVLAEENYDETCDLWSCGVVALELLRDEFLGVERDRAALKLVRTLRETLSSKAPGCVVRALLQDEPSRRCRAAEALELLGGGAALLPSAPLSPPFDFLRLELPIEAERALDQLDGRTLAARAYAARALDLVPDLDPRHAALLAVKLAEGQAPACDELDLHYRDVRAAELRVLMAADGCLLYASPFPTAAVVEAGGGGGGS